MMSDQVQMLLARYCLTPVVRDQVVTELSERLDWSSQRAKFSAEDFFKTLPGYLYEVWLVSGNKSTEVPEVQRSLSKLMAVIQQLPVFTLYTAYQPSYVQLRELQQQLMTYFEKPLLIQSEYDPRIIGGFRLETPNGFHISQTLDEKLSL